MKNKSRADQALEYIQSIDSDELDEAAKKAREQAINDVKMLIEHIEQRNTVQNSDALTHRVPDGWDSEDEWYAALEDAYSKTDIPESRGELTTKTIDGLEYYFLRWNEDGTVISQPVGPVNPAR